MAARPQRVLVANDDGITSDGLIAIATAVRVYNPTTKSLPHSIQLAAAGLDVRVAAPSRQQSGVSHCISLFTPVTAEPYMLPAPLERLTAYKSANSIFNLCEHRLTLSLLGQSTALQQTASNSPSPLCTRTGSQTSL
jgi:hypothetical protein